MHLFNKRRKGGYLIIGLSHVTFFVKNLDRSEELYRKILNAKKLYDSGDRGISVPRKRFFVIGDAWVVLVESDPRENKTSSHVAFKIEPSNYDRLLDAINSFGLESRESRRRICGEGLSVYFYDYDNNLIELYAGTLQEVIKSYNDVGLGV